MGGLRRWTPSPYPGRQALSREAYKLPGVRPTHFITLVALFVGITQHDVLWRFGRRSDFLEEIRPEDVKALVIGVRIEQPRGRRDTTEERIAVLWGETKARDLMPIAHGERRDRYHRLVEQTSKIAMIAPEGENRPRH